MWTAPACLAPTFSDEKAAAGFDGSSRGLIGGVASQSDLLQSDQACLVERSCQQRPGDSLTASRWRNGKADMTANLFQCGRHAVAQVHDAQQPAAGLPEPGRGRYASGKQFVLVSRGGQKGDRLVDRSCAWGEVGVELIGVGVEFAKEILQSLPMPLLQNYQLSGRRHQTGISGSLAGCNATGSCGARCRLRAVSLLRGSSRLPTRVG